MQQVGVVGYGVVGKAITATFKTYCHKVVVNDIDYRKKDFNTPSFCTLETIFYSDVIFICVPTPFTTTNFPIYTEDLDINNILKILRKFDRIAQKDTTDHIPVIVIKSTVPVGTIDYLAHAFPLLCIAYNPEFLRQRYSYNDALNPDRIIIGTNEQVAKDALMKLYHWIPCPIFLVDPKTAELAKLLSNAFLVTKVAFSQQIREAVNLFGIEVFPERLLTSDPRIGPSHLNSDMGKIPKDSPCLPKDMKEIMRSVPTSFFKVIFTEAIEQ